MRPLESTFVSSDAAFLIRLTVCVSAGHLEVVRLLLDSGADVDGRIRLCSAAHSPEESAPDSGPEFRRVGGFGQFGAASSPLHQAAWYGHADVAAELIARGADVLHASEARHACLCFCFCGHSSFSSTDSARVVSLVWVVDDQWAVFNPPHFTHNGCECSSVCLLCSSRTPGHSATAGRRVRCPHRRWPGAGGRPGRAPGGRGGPVGLREGARDGLSSRICRMFRCESGDSTQLIAFALETACAPSSLLSHPISSQLTLGLSH